MGRPKKNKTKIEQEDEDFIDDFLKDISDEKQDIRKVIDMIKKLDEKEIAREIEEQEGKIKSYEEEIKSMRKEIQLLKCICNLKSYAGKEF